ncbi:MAG: class I SAM-dependent methyltransferase [Candidatus Methylomirabilales bacterium]
MRPIVEARDALAFWEARYAAGLVYGTQPTSIAPRLAALFRQAQVHTILEAGCGSGRDALYYAEQGFAVTGLDLSGNGLRRARARARAAGLAVAFVQGDLADPALRPGCFDACVAVHLIHLQPAGLRQRLVNSLWHLARDGGILAMANYSTAEAGFETWPPYPEPNTRVDPRGKLVHFFEAGELEALLPPARFEILALEAVDLCETPDSGPVAHKEWLAIARKVRAC